MKIFEYFYPKLNMKSVIYTPPPLPEGNDLLPNKCVCSYCKRSFGASHEDTGYCCQKCRSRAYLAHKKGIEPVAPQFRSGGIVEKPIVLQNNIPEIKKVEPKPQTLPIQHKKVVETKVVAQEKPSNWKPTPIPISTSTPIETTTKSKPETFEDFTNVIVRFQTSTIGLDDQYHRDNKLRSKWREEVLKHCFELIIRHTKDYSFSTMNDLDKRQIIELYKGKIGSEKDREELNKFPKEI